MSTDREQKMNTAQKLNLSGTVLDRIEKECIEPLPRWHFLFSEVTMWILWVFSILVGAAAVAVMVYVSMLAGYSQYEATHETLFELMLDVMPWLWGAIFVLMAAIAYFNMRSTRKGYKYPMWQIVISSLVLSVIGGLGLNQLGAGHFIEESLATSMPLYPSFEKRERGWWLHPEDGLLIGRFVSNDASTTVANFIDADEKEWVIVIDELNPRDLEVFYSGEVVKILGVQGTTSLAVFHGCGVFPWMHKNSRTVTDLQKARADFRVMIDDYKDKNALRKPEKSLFPSSTSASDTDRMIVRGVCPTMPILQKMLKSL